MTKGSPFSDIRPIPEKAERMKFEITPFGLKDKDLGIPDSRPRSAHYVGSTAVYSGSGSWPTWLSLSQNSGQNRWILWVEIDPEGMDDPSEAILPVACCLRKGLKDYEAAYLMVKDYFVACVHYLNESAPSVSGGGDVLHDEEMAEICEQVWPSI
jgi:hypothetical protein